MFSLRLSSLLLLISILLLTLSPFSGFAAVTIPGGDIIQDASISVDVTSGSAVEVSRSFGFRILSVAKLVISGFALVYMVLMGAYMVIYNDNEEKIKAQKHQFIYLMVGFLFLNVPGILYPIFFGESKAGTELGNVSDSAWSDFMGGVFWEPGIVNATLGGLISFFQVFIFAVAVLTFTWGLFRIILSGGDEEQVKNGKNRIIYGVLGLIFLGFVKGWATILAMGDFGSATAEVWTLGKTLFGIAIFFAGPVAIFFLIVGAYYYITSGGDEERTKKWKSIIVNTFLATLILLASYSFLSELVNFSL